MKLLFFAIDGLDWNYLKKHKWSLWENLPYKGKIMPEPDTMISLSLWTTMTTGVSKEEHGLCRRGWIKNPWILGSNFVEYKRLWDYLDCRSFIFSLVGTYPPHPLNGVMIGGVAYTFSDICSYPPEIWKDIQDKYNYLGFASFPGELKKDTEILKYILKKDKGLDLSLFTNPVKRRRYKENVLNSAKNGVEVVKYTIKEHGPFDFTLIYLRAIDDLLHVTREKSEVLEVHQLIFDAIEELVDIFDPDDFLIVSDHGLKTGEGPGWDRLCHVHDMENGIWGSTYNFELKDHFDVTPAILKYYGLDFKPERVSK